MGFDFVTAQSHLSNMFYRRFYWVWALLIFLWYLDQIGRLAVNHFHRHCECEPDEQPGCNAAPLQMHATQGEGLPVEETHECAYLYRTLNFAEPTEIWLYSAFLILIVGFLCVSSRARYGCIWYFLTNRR